MNVGTLMAKLAGIRKSLDDVLNENVSRSRSQGETRFRANYEPALVAHYFEQANAHVNKLQVLLPELYGDFQATETEASVKMAMGAG